MEESPAPDEAAAPRRRRRRRSGGGKGSYARGRAWLAVLWVVLRVADLPLAWLAFRTVDPAPQIRTPVIIAILWTTVLFIALWARQIWARYITILLLTYYVFSYGLALSMVIVSVARHEVLVIPDRFAILLNGALLYLGTLIVIVRSKNIRYLTDPSEGWQPRDL